MIDFSDIFDDRSDENLTDGEIRLERLARDDRDIFENKRLHHVTATISMEQSGQRDYETRTYRATRSGPGGKEESIGLVFKGQRLDDMQSGALLAEMEKERQGSIAKGDFQDPKRDVDLLGAWKARSWKDSEGKSHKAFDLVVASWSFKSEAGVKITEGATPTVATATRQNEREASIKEKAESRIQIKPSRAIDRGELDF